MPNPLNGWDLVPLLLVAGFQSCLICCCLWMGLGPNSSAVSERWWTLLPESSPPCCAQAGLFSMSALLWGYPGLLACPLHGAALSSLAASPACCLFARLAEWQMTGVSAARAPHMRISCSFGISCSWLVESHRILGWFGLKGTLKII